jgi:uncharacterized membrane protein
MRKFINICNHCKKRFKSKDKNEEHSLELLRERLAKGEITKKYGMEKNFQQMNIWQKKSWNDWK